MCFGGGKTPAPPKPPPMPIPPNPREEGLVAQQDEIRRRRAANMTRTGTVLTTPMGDAGAGGSVSRASAGGGTKLGGNSGFI